MDGKPAKSASSTNQVGHDCQFAQRWGWSCGEFSSKITNSLHMLTRVQFHLHFMHLGTWILLTRPSLMKAIEMTTSGTVLGGSILSAVVSDARVWCVITFIEAHTCQCFCLVRDQLKSNEYSVTSSIRLIKSAAMILDASIVPKRSFLPVYVSSWFSIWLAST